MLKSFDFLDKRSNSIYQITVLILFVIILIIAVSFPNLSITRFEGTVGIAKKDVRDAFLLLMGFVIAFALVPFWFILLDSYWNSMTRSTEIRQKQSQFIKRSLATLGVMAFISIAMYLVLKPSDSEYISFNDEYLPRLTAFLWHKMNSYLLISSVLLGFSAVVGFVVEQSLHKQDSK